MTKGQKVQTMHEVKDGTRILQFNGKLLAASSSWRRGSTRWIEFELYKTENGSYVLSRIGISLVFHGAACPLVKRYGLSEAPVDNVDADSVPCEQCSPTFDVDLVFQRSQDIGHRLVMSQTRCLRPYTSMTKVALAILQRLQNVFLRRHL